MRLDVLSDPRSNEHDLEDARAWGYTSIMTVPLLAGGDLIGFLELYNCERGEFARDDEQRKVHEDVGEQSRPSPPRGERYLDQDEGPHKIE